MKQDMPAMRNPFHDGFMRRQYQAAVTMFWRKHPNLIRGGTPTKGNSFAMEFWRGYFDILPESWDRASKKMIGYAFYRAGQDCRKAEEARAKLGGEYVVMEREREMK